MNTLSGIWVLLLIMNGYTIDYSIFKTNAQCEDHRKTVERGLKQAESPAVVRCEWRASK